MQKQRKLSSRRLPKKKATIYNKQSIKKSSSFHPSTRYPIRHFSSSLSQSTSQSTQQPKFITNNIYNSFTDTIGNTPLIRLNFASELTQCNIYGKAEFLNPGGSVKDRAAKFLISQAEQDGILIPGQPGIIVESTAGNLGIGLTSVANSKGYRTIIVIPETQTKEKKDILRQAGAILIENPAVPFKNPCNYRHVGKRLSILLRQLLKDKNIPVYHPNQWDNTTNAKAHELTTSQEIALQMNSIGLNIDGFSCAIGTGATIVGTTHGLRQYYQQYQPQHNVQIAITDPLGALPCTYYTTGELKMGLGSSLAEGIGQSALTGNLLYKNWKPDHCFEINDNDALDVLNRLNYEEGLQLGLSAGINVAGVIEFAKKLGPGHNLVTILPDGAMKYASKMYNLPFLKSKNLPTPFWMEDEFDIMKVINGNNNNNNNNNNGNSNINNNNHIIQREQYKIDHNVHLLPELLGNINMNDLIHEALNNHDIHE